MGQFAKDWEQLKALIDQKNDMIKHQTAQIAALQQQASAQQSLDAEDQKAVADVRKMVSDNPPAVTMAAQPAVAPSSASIASRPPAPAMTTFTK